MIGWLIVAAALLGAPLFAIFGTIALGAYHSIQLDPSIVISELARLATMPLLRALPLFALAGYVLAASRASERLLDLSRAAFGWMPGGLALVSLIACTLLTAFTGASGVTIVALGGLLLPALQEEGYGDRFSLGLVTSGGNMGVLFAPSLPLILFAVIANPIASEVTIDRLFLAALLPGVLTLAALGLYGIATGLGRRVPRQPFSARALARALWAARWEAPLPVVVLGGIYSGKIAVSEAAVLTAAYTLLVETVIQREVSLKRLAGVIRDSTMLVGGVLVILGLGMAITNFLVDQEAPARLVDWAGRTFHHPVVFLIALNVFLLIVGCLMDIYTAIIVFVPMLIPLGLQFGVNPVHLGVIFLANLAIGYSTPPVGMNLFIAAIRFERPLLKLAAASLSFIGILLAVLLLITYVPALSLALLGGAP
ncbi:MAG TPA: TRAP transporter large permease subunit [Kiritimatiellia bacterium]|nr:TRAP transporter large permease subunit [Kiritimatiellia bacterium]HSA19657.1 TRAP transporter large permease subunit [Kiritimatiellia bacterium]